MPTQPISSIGNKMLLGQHEPTPASS